MLRSLCCVALLANCGLMVPAQAATVPFVDAFMLRNFSGDSPIDGKSSFAVEMDEMRWVGEWGVGGTRKAGSQMLHHLVLAPHMSGNGQLCCF